MIGVTTSNVIPIGNCKVITQPEESHKNTNSFILKKRDWSDNIECHSDSQLQNDARPDKSVLVKGHKSPLVSHELSSEFFNF